MVVNQDTSPGRELATEPTGLKPHSPEWWLHRLERRLTQRRPGLRTYDAYYSGDHPLAFASEKFRSAFGGLFNEFADNWAYLVVDAVEERLDVEGFRLPTDANNPSEGDKDAWRIWQKNNLDSDSEIAHTEALINGECYALVWPGRDGEPEITVEHPDQMTVEMQAGNRRRRAAALKVWREDDGFDLATLYLSDAIYKFRARSKSSGLEWTGSSANRWVPRELDSEPWPLANPMGQVPVVPLFNRPRLLRRAESEIHKVVPIQDAVNKMVADLLVASEFGAFRQRWVSGIDIPRDPDTGKPIEPFQAAVNRLWTSRDADTKFGEFSETDLTNIVAAIEMLIQHIASQTRTPPHYFYLRGTFPSGESIKAAETGLVAKTKRKHRSFGEGWEEVMRLAFNVLDDARAGAFSMETIWGDPESRSESEHVDAIMKKRALGVPLQQCWEDLGYSPQQIDRFLELLKQEVELAPLLAAMPRVGRGQDSSSGGDATGNL